MNQVLDIITELKKEIEQLTCDIHLLDIELRDKSVKLQAKMQQLLYYKTLK